MNNHAPKHYECPFCKVIAGVEDELHSKQDVIFESATVLAFVAPKWWINNPGSLLVIPKQHHENLYDMPDEILGDVYTAVKQIAIAVRDTYGCDGTSTRQHNEPAGNQDVWHFHVHVFPRWHGDELYKNQDNKRFTSADERLEYSNKLRRYFNENS